MSDASTAAGGGSSLEEILLRRLEGPGERPALLDREEFAAHIASAFDGDVPAEAFVERFFAGNPEVAAAVPDVAHAFVVSVGDRLDVYEFDVSRLEFVVIEDAEKVVVAGEGGQVEATCDSRVRSAIRAAVVHPGQESGAHQEPGEARAYLVRDSGGVELLDSAKLAAALAPLSFKRAIAPPIQRPGSRLARFGARARPLSPEREEQVLRENDARMSLPMVVPAAQPSMQRPESAEPAVFVLLPDGSVARPAMGSATRWQQMVSGWTARAALLDFGGQSVPVSGDERFSVSGNKLTALVSRGGGDSPGDLATRTDLRAGALAQVRSDFAPVRVLGDDELGELVARGDARLVPGWRASATAALPRESFWIQPEAWFTPTEGDRALVAQVDPSSGLEAPSEAGSAAPQGVYQGPSADMQTVAAAPAGEPPPIATATATEPPPIAPAAAAPAPVAAPPAVPSPVAPPPVVPSPAFAAAVPATSVVPPPVVPTSTPPVLPLPTVTAKPIATAIAPPGATLPLPTISPPTAVNVRPTFTVGGTALDGAARGDAAPPGAAQYRLPAPLSPGVPLGSRIGAIPRTALEALQLSLERSGAAGGWRLPAFSKLPGPELAPAGVPPRQRSPEREPRDAVIAVSPRHRWIRRPIVATHQPDRVLLILPFPNHTELHVGRDLSDALSTWLAAPVVPRAPRPLPGRSASHFSRHDAALSFARRGFAELRQPEVSQLLAAHREVILQTLPPLLRAAVRAGGEWLPGPGAPMPAAVRAFALRGPYEAPRIVSAAPESAQSREHRPQRALGVGEDEIVIPTPLWAEMGREALLPTREWMSSRLAATSYLPPLGSYRLLPSHLESFSVVDAPPQLETPEPGELAGPAVVRVEEIAGRLQARAETGHVVVTTARDVEVPRRRIRVGPPLDPAALAARPAVVPTAPVAPQQAPAQPRQIAKRAPTAAREAKWPIEGTIVSPGPLVRPMTSALEQAERLSRARQTGDAPERPAGKIERVPPLPLSQSGPIQPPRNAALVSQRGTGEVVAPRASPSAIALSTWQAPATAAGTWHDVAGRELAAPGFNALHSEADDAMQPSSWRRALPAALRFRYVSAPLWWSASLRAGTPAAPRVLQGAAEQSLRVGLQASNSAAALWRSILAGGRHDDADLSGGMDRRHDAPARELSGVERRLDVLVQLGIIGGGAAHATAQPRRGPETVYVAIDEQGRAGPVAQAQLEKARSLAQPIDMRIVAALPPSPPPLEAMSAIRGVPDTAVVPRARPVQAQSQQPAAEEPVSHSRIEGSVEAIAQRIYHRIRRRIAADRERFGG